jgi:hypothetical protein
MGRGSVSLYPARAQHPRTRAILRGMATKTLRITSPFLLELRPPPDRLSGEDIRQLQRDLVAAGFDPGPVDGIYGPRTARAVAQYIASKRPVPPVQIGGIVERVLSQARADWAKGISEANQANDGPLAGIFRDSGWALRVDLTDSGRVKDWCGMSVAAWAFRAGFDGQLRSSLYQTNNVRSFFSYASAGNVHHRTDREVRAPGGEWRPIADVHEERGSKRTWVEGSALHRQPLASWGIRPGMVLLISHTRSLTVAHHITLVESFDGRTLVTLEGNASGTGPDTKRWTNACVRVTRDLSVESIRRTVFGFGSFSDVDFDASLEYPR